MCCWTHSTGWCNGIAGLKKSSRGWLARWRPWFPFARCWKQRPGTQAPTTPEPVLVWLRSCLPRLASTGQGGEPPRLALERGATRLTFRLHQQIGDSDGKAEDGDWLIVMREVSDTAVIEAMSLSFKLTAKEAEVLYWVVKGKTNKDIGDILGSSPMTVKKHLERIFVKMGVETRTAAAGMAMTRIRQLHPQFEG